MGWGGAAGQTGRAAAVGVLMPGHEWGRQVGGIDTRPGLWGLPQGQQCRLRDSDGPFPERASVQGRLRACW